MTGFRSVAEGIRDLVVASKAQRRELRTRYCVLPSSYPDTLSTILESFCSKTGMRLSPIVDIERIRTRAVFIYDRKRALLCRFQFTFTELPYLFLSCVCKETVDGMLDVPQEHQWGIFLSQRKDILESKWDSLEQRFGMQVA